jgi:hypothetical protein
MTFDKTMFVYAGEEGRSLNKGKLGIGGDIGQCNSGEIIWKGDENGAKCDRKRRKLSVGGSRTLWIGSVSDLQGWRL